MKFIRVGEVLVNNCSQLDLIPVPEESRQSGLNQHRFENLQRRAGISAKSAVLRISHRDEPKSRQVVGCRKIKESVPVVIGFESTCPECQSLELFSDIHDTADFFLAAVADDEPFMSQALARDGFLQGIERLVAFDSES